MSFNLRRWDDPFKLEEADDGIERRVLAFTDEIMLVHYTFDKGAVFPEHEHDEIQQAVYVLDGEIELFGDKSARLKTGDSFVVGPGIRHGVEGIAEVTKLLDTFSPAISDYGKS